MELDGAMESWILATEAHREARRVQEAARVDQHERRLNEQHERRLDELDDQRKNKPNDNNSNIQLWRCHGRKPQELLRHM
eukprot:10314338-Heterocapsa_arctica.AAC.1